ncbi:MAG: hypothetical protein J5970_04380 [Bacilli bacterium]|nr:hypothetical protein [Bacilli bacterium]
MEKTNKKKNIIILLGLVILLLSIGIFLYMFLIKDDIKQIKNDVELNSKTKLLSLFNKPKNDTIISKDKDIDTTTLGVQHLKIVYKTRLGKKETLEFSINVIDTTKPVIKCKDVIEVEVDAQDIKIDTEDNSKDDVIITIDGDYDLGKEGEYKITVVATDKSGNKATKKVTLKVTAPKFSLEGYYTVKTDKAWYSLSFRDNNYVEYEINPCHGMGCGLFIMDGRYEVNGNKLKLTLDHNTDDTLEREEDAEPTIMELTIKDEKTLIYEEKDLTFTYSEKQW